MTITAGRRCQVLLRWGTRPGVASRRECGRQPAALCRSECGCGHVMARRACRECAALPGTCRRCWDEGHECAVTVARVVTYGAPR